ncbi:MAG: hypothetical protein O2955_01840 [Planctomycetota bacterium]|nr:hypothetical protein [Planctomycetota bacterium]MDA1211225.1 hypothetical protein [Planctomycetota bacterium]
MTDHFDELQTLQRESGAGPTIDRLIETLKADKQYHRIFDALLLKVRQEMGLSLVRPTSFDDVPAEKKDEFEKAYIDAARAVGKMFLEDKQLGPAWMYFRTIQETDAVRDVLDKLDVEHVDGQAIEELINIGLHEGAHPVKGFEAMLRHHGTCSTITAFDHNLSRIDNAQREQIAKMLLDQLHTDLLHSLQRDVQRRLPTEPPAESIRELIAGRDWLFEEHNYHIDVSHLNSIVRFCRSLPAGDPALAKAIELCDYGSKLSTQFQYPSEPPFQDYYTAHKAYFKVLADDDREENLNYFREILKSESEIEQQQLIALVLVDMMTRIDRSSDAVDIAKDYLSNVEEPQTFSFSQLCQEHQRWDLLEKSARERGDLVQFTATLLSNKNDE